MENAFLEYLLQQGYTETSASGNPSTAPQYVRSINQVLQAEHLTWDVTAEQVASLVTMYDVGGEKEEEGAKSHRTVINALKRFQEFVRSK